MPGKNNSHPQKNQNPGTDQADLCGCSIHIVRESSELTFWCLKVEKPGSVHHHFQNLLMELKKSTDTYELRVANRLYGEKDFPFLQVSFLVYQVPGPRAPSPNGGGGVQRSRGTRTGALPPGAGLPSHNPTRWSVQRLIAHQ